MCQLAILSVIFAVIAIAPARADVFSMTPYKAQCNEEARIYASCLDQRTILKDGLAAAKAQGKRAVVIFGFNDCPPCNALEKWIETPDARRLFARYVTIEISIFDPARKLRPEVFSEIIPSLGLPINNSPPYGVPDVSIVDPKTKHKLGEPLIGFNSDDPSGYIMYLDQWSQS